MPKPSSIVGFVAIPRYGPSLDQTNDTKSTPKKVTSTVSDKNRIADTKGGKGEKNLARNEKHGFKGTEVDALKMGMADRGKVVDKSQRYWRKQRSMVI